ncbi:MAG: redox-sensing transcriptional repressor Rex [Clostridia bacterium]
MSDHVISIPEPTLRRLPIYHQYLLREKQNGESYVSCPKIANELELTTIQVRKDLQAAGAVGRPRVGYIIDEVLDVLADLLGYKNTKDALLVGAGNLGLALLDYEAFTNQGLNIVAAFDVDKEKIGKIINGKRVYSLDKFNHIAKRLNIQIGIITTPAKAAVEVSKLMVDSSIKAIWNFAPIHLNLPENIVVEDVNLSASFSVLSNKLKEKLS